MYEPTIEPFSLFLSGDSSEDAEISMKFGIPRSLGNTDWEVGMTDLLFTSTHRQMFQPEKINYVVLAPRNEYALFRDYVDRKRVDRNFDLVGWIEQIFPGQAARIVVFP